jgi:hypothetical protein
MPNSEMIKITDLILKGSVAQVPISVRGSLENGKLGELSGWVNLDKSLVELLDDLGGGFKDAAQFLRQIAGVQDQEFTIDSLSFGYHNGAPKFVQLVLTMQVHGNVYRFVTIKMTGQDGFIAGLDLKWNKDLFSGNILSGLVGDISLGNLGVYYASHDFQDIRYDPDQDFQDIDSIALPMPSIKGRKFNKGLNLSAQISVGRINLLDWLEKKSNNVDIGPEPQVGEEVPAKAGENLPSKLTTRWVKIDKSVGPLFVKRVGLSYEAPYVAIKFDAGVDLSCITMTLLGFGLSYPLNEITTDVGEIVKKLRFHLDGASVALDMGPVAIAGGLLKVSDHPLQLDGTLMVRAGDLTIGALGSYADLNGMPSLFVFGALQKALGGPPYFFITGLAFGFGINRALILPPINDVHNFPLIKAATDPAYLGKKLDLREISLKLSCYIYPSPGNFWMAAGLKFTSFGMLNCFALATVSVGTQFQIALLGLAKITVPPQPPGAPEIEPIACAELALKVSLSLSTGVLAVEGQLTDNSFILSRKCRLTGGFAFCCWFWSPHAGDFVVSLGGYHPRFIPPSHYPTVPRLGMNWSVSSNLSITGEVYFALTPSCCMAGGKLNAVFAVGNLRAWFYAYADFLISWKPFYYDVAIGVCIGVSYRVSLLGISKTFSIELGATVHLWGPAFGGVAHVSWWVISFDIDFGSIKNPVPEPIEWDEFHQSFLPQQQNEKEQKTQQIQEPVVSTIRITGGLIREQEIEKENNGEIKTLRVVNGHEFSFSTEALIPCTDVRLNNEPIDPGQEVNKAKLGIRPMGIGSLQSEHAVVVEKEGQTATGWERYLTPVLIRKNVPYALWSDDLSRPDRPSAKQIKNVLSGITVSLRNREPSHGLDAIDLKKFRYEIIEKDIDWADISIPGQIPAPGDRTLMNTIWANPDVDEKRNAILQTLAHEGLQPQKVDVPELAAHATDIFQSLPEMGAIGEALA